MSEEMKTSTLAPLCQHSASHDSNHVTGFGYMIVDTGRLQDGLRVPLCAICGPISLPSRNFEMITVRNQCFDTDSLRRRLCSLL
ncbi:hypothetical protein J6590_027225 [Homalodisca vitripennis]|nr:hypothetical protein J6590_027225 [Homalodisca vitripennis]